MRIPSFGHASYPDWQQYRSLPRFVRAATKNRLRQKLQLSNRNEVCAATPTNALPAFACGSMLPRSPQAAKLL